MPGCKPAAKSKGGKRTTTHHASKGKAASHKGSAKHTTHHATKGKAKASSGHRKVSHSAGCK